MSAREVAYRNQNVLTLREGGPLAPKWPRAVRKAIDQEMARGLHGAASAQADGFIASARIDAAELVTERALIGIDRLNRVEAAMSKSDPLQAARYAGLVDDFVLVARCELRNLSRGF